MVSPSIQKYDSRATSGQDNYAKGRTAPVRRLGISRQEAPGSILGGWVTAFPALPGSAPTALNHNPLHLIK